MNDFVRAIAEGLQSELPGDVEFHDVLFPFEQDSNEFAFELSGQYAFVDIDLKTSQLRISSQRTFDLRDPASIDEIVATLEGHLGIHGEMNMAYNRWMRARTEVDSGSSPATPEEMGGT